jgi:cyclopropane fatty-acyl-phospholipid synthase-like methyltransferase
VTPSLSPGYFDTLYATNPDPWSFQTSDYEHAKYIATIAALGGAQFARGFEIGCSIGVLTRRLASHCDTLLSIDVAEAALAQARQRCADLKHVTFARMQVARFDLIVLSEVLYYFDSAGIAAIAAKVRASTDPGAPVVLVHWLGATNYPTGGDAAAEQFISACAGRAVCTQSRTAHYRLDVLR